MCREDAATLFEAKAREMLSRVEADQPKFTLDKWHPKLRSEMADAEELLDRQDDELDSMIQTGSDEEIRELVSQQAVEEGKDFVPKWLRDAAVAWIRADEANAPDDAFDMMFEIYSDILYQQEAA